jgi:uncharacterized SAM-binding protein YcdF (DUF218 family)
MVDGTPRFVKVNTSTHWVFSKRRMRSLAVLGLLWVMLGLFVALISREAWLMDIGEFLVVEAKPRRADAVVVVSQGLDDRPIFAAELYALGLAPVVMTLGAVAPASGAGLTGAARDAEILHNWGVPIERIVKLDDTSNLQEEAAHSRDALVARRATSAIVLSDPIRMRRVALVFGPFYRAAGITFIPVINPARGFNPDGWWRRETDAVVVVLEYLKMALDLTWR